MQAPMNCISVNVSPKNRNARGAAKSGPVARSGRWHDRSLVREALVVRVPPLYFPLLFKRSWSVVSSKASATRFLISPKSFTSPGSCSMGLG